MSELSERVLAKHRPDLTLGQPRKCICGVVIGGLFSPHVAEVTEAAVRETIAAAVPSQQWGWGTDGWKPGDPDDPDDFFQPVTATSRPFTEADVRRNIARFGGIAVVRTTYTAPEPTPWKDADA